MIVLWPISVLILSLFYLCKRCCSKEYKFKIDLEDINKSLLDQSQQHDQDPEAQNKLPDIAEQ